MTPAEMLQQITELRLQVHKQGYYPAGHYYSPIPSEEEVLAYVRTRQPPPREIPGVELRQEAQLALLTEYATFYADVPFPEQPEPERRYRYKNAWFNPADAIFLYSFLRKYQPRRIIEVGSGFSSAALLDTVDSCFAERPAITFIEPNPERLHRLLKPSDKAQVQIVEQRIQDAPRALFQSLGPGDFLFIDSSHVVKCASDVQLLLFEILPSLPAGVFVHFHDVYYPFDYPSEWLLQGRFWNENYLLRAFLSYNSAWDIHFFNSYVHLLFGDLLREKMPRCAARPGGSLYLQRKG